MHKSGVHFNYEDADSVVLSSGAVGSSGGAVW